MSVLSYSTGYLKHLVTEAYDIYFLYVDRPFDATADLTLTWTVAPVEYQPMAQIECMMREPIDLSLREPLINDPSLQIYPNPNNGRFTLVNLAQTKEVLMQVSDMGGRVLYNTTLYMVNNEEYGIDISSKVIGGSYLLSFTFDDRKQSHHIIIY